MATYYANSYSYPSFESLKISTMTGIVQINQTVNLEGAYCWLRLPFYKWQDGAQHRLTAPIPYSGVPGTISSIRGGNLCRGYPRKTKPLKNSITVYLDTIDKNVSIKVGPQKLHITGGKSREELGLATQLLLQQLQQAESDFRYCQLNRDAWAKVIEWFLHAVRGPTVLRPITGPPSGVDGEVPPLIEYVMDQQTNPIVILPSDELGLDKRMLDIVTNFAREFQYFSDVYKHLLMMNMCNVVLTTTNTSTNTGVDQGQQETTGNLALQLGMTNYNYNIGFDVDRLALADYMEANGFVIGHHNATDVGVKFLLPFETTDTVIAHRKKKTKHTFILYRSGQITQSSPNPELAQLAYQKFMSIVASVYPLVQMSTASSSL